MDNYYEFKASSVELATKNGLEELGLTEEEVEIEVVQKGGIFAKAIVRITPIQKEEKEEAEAVEETEDEFVEDAPESDGSEETEERRERPERRERRRREDDPEYALKKEMRDAGKEKYILPVISMQNIAAIRGSMLTPFGSPQYLHKYSPPERNPVSAL